MTRPRGPYKVGQERRAAIVTAASAAFADVGYDGVTLAEIAEAADVSLSNLQHYFPTRRHLLSEVARQRLADIEQDWTEAADEPEIHALLERAVDTLAQMQARPGLVDLAVRVSADAIDPAAPAHSWMAEAYARVAQENATRFAACAEAGQLRDGVDPLTASRTMQAIGDGMELQWALSRHTMDLPGFTARAIAGFGRAIIAPEHLDEERIARLEAR
ncbi:TetR/AcrR family transcriptional regulator [Demequina capsici]|uniref:Helix-turn-helix domain-containing protein n=1 Tax=Demequina capsici TaxID=3075620 RepID=A0AA96JE70_9MICO|nr:helix-turn-helix domain-containing protein [Demequina sp. OYTSA14]WNM25349.1 helix-turn-helix domain-containing protein [Demequina sp. OYTSA14]